MRQRTTTANLRHVTLEDGRVIDYAIDPSNRRTGKSLNGQRQWQLIWQSQIRPLARLKANGTLEAVYYYADKPNVPEAMDKGGKTYRIVSDHLGSVRLVIDTDTGEIAQRMDYDPWGKVLYDSNPGFQPFDFAGGLYDPHAGHTMFNPPHLGRLVRQECLDPLHLSVTEAAKVLGVTRQTLNNLVNENARISPEMAIRLEKAFGSTVDTWLRMQAAYDLVGDAALGGS